MNLCSGLWPEGHNVGVCPHAKHVATILSLTSVQRGHAHCCMRLNCSRMGLDDISSISSTSNSSSFSNTCPLIPTRISPLSIAPLASAGSLEPARQFSLHAKQSPEHHGADAHFLLNNPYERGSHHRLVWHELRIHARVEVEVELPRNYDRHCYWLPLTASAAQARWLAIERLIMSDM